MKLRLAPFKFKSPSTAAALALAGAIMLGPANLLPVLSTGSDGRVRSDTIFSGAVELWHQGLWALAAIVITASIVIPVLKLAGLGWLLMNMRAAASGRADARRLTHLHAAVDFIGRWSMLDVFLAAFLTGLVQFGAFSTVVPRSGLPAFAAVVVLTVLATQAFDPRLLWRSAGDSPP